MRQKRSEEYLPASPDVLSLSFLDVLSCGFGAATLLFLIFSVMPHSGTTLGANVSSSAQKGTAHSVGVTTIDDLVKNAVVFIEVRIKSPPNAIALIPNDPWDGTLPRKATKIRPTSPDGSTEVLFAARIESGKYVKKPVTVRLNGPSPPTDLVVEIKVSVGGSTAPLGPLTFKATDLEKSNGVIATINLQSGDSKTWIQPTDGK